MTKIYFIGGLDTSEGLKVSSNYDIIVMLWLNRRKKMNVKKDDIGCIL